MKEIPALAAAIALIILSSFLSSLDFSRTGFPGLIGESVYQEQTGQIQTPAELYKSEMGLSGSSNPSCIPIFIVSGIDENHTRLRTHVSSRFSSGVWMPDEPEMSDPMIFNFGRVYAVKPLVNLSGYLPVAKDTTSISIQALYNSSAGVFYAENVTSTYYGVIFPEKTFSPERGVHKPADIEMSAYEFSRIRDLALKITENATTDYDRVKMIESYLINNFEYSPYFNNTEISPYVFLFQERKGVATHFTTAFIALVTSLDIPARAVFGYLASPTPSSQVVYSCQAHMWAEVKFGDSWIEFDPTPKVRYKIPTSTEITRWDSEILEGENISIGGNVRLVTGKPVEGGYVEIYLKKNKTDVDGILLGISRVENGSFYLTERINQSGKYSIVAHYTGSLLYLDSWSDPEVKVLSIPELETNLMDIIPQEFTLKVKVIHRNQSVSNKSLIVEVDDKAYTLKTDNKGEVMLGLTLSKGNHRIRIVSPKEDLFGEVTIQKVVEAGEFSIIPSNRTLIAGEKNTITMGIFFNGKPYTGKASINGIEYSVEKGNLTLSFYPEKPGKLSLRIVIGGFEKELLLISKARTKIEVEERDDLIVFRVVSFASTTPAGYMEINGERYMLMNGQVELRKEEKRYDAVYLGDEFHLPSSLDYRKTDLSAYLFLIPVMAGLLGYYYIRYPRIKFEFLKEYSDLPDIWKVGEKIRYSVVSNCQYAVDVDGKLADGEFQINNPGVYTVTVKAVKNGKVRKKIHKSVEIVDDYGKGIERVFRMFEKELEKRGMKIENMTARELMGKIRADSEKKKKLLRLFELYEYAGMRDYSRNEFIESFEIYKSLRGGMK